MSKYFYTEFDSDEYVVKPTDELKKLAQENAGSIEFSIWKYEQLLDHIQYETRKVEYYPSPNDCSLCREYWFGFQDDKKCLNCPIYIKTGQQFCQGTPFDSMGDSITNVQGLTLKELIEDGIQFLKNLDES